MDIEGKPSLGSGETFGTIVDSFYQKTKKKTGTIKGIGDNVPYFTRKDVINYFSVSKNKECQRHLTTDITITTIIY